MIRALTAALPLALLLTPGIGQADTGTLGAVPPAAAPFISKDGRLLTRLYDEGEVVRINGRLGVQATIGFGEKEAIENVAVGDAEAWQITPNKRADLLFVKPLKANARTNMTVVTDKHTYFFDLVAGTSGSPLYMLRFTYRDEPGKDKGGLSDAERQALQGDLAAAPADPALLNFSWARKGDAALMPARVYDDGESTYLLWGAKQAVPAILVLNEKGEEGPVNYAVRGQTLVLEDVPGQIVLRLGKKSATLSNQRPAAAAVPAPMPAPSAQTPMGAVPAQVSPAAAPLTAVAVTDSSKR